MHHINLVHLDLIFFLSLYTAVDSHTPKHIYEQYLVEDLMKDRTRALVTHHVGLCLRGAANVVVMKDG